MGKMDLFVLLFTLLQARVGLCGMHDHCDNCQTKKYNLLCCYVEEQCCENLYTDQTLSQLVSTTLTLPSVTTGKESESKNQTTPLPPMNVFTTPDFSNTIPNQNKTENSTASTSSPNQQQEIITNQSPMTTTSKIPSTDNTTEKITQTSPSIISIESMMTSNNTSTLNPNSTTSIPADISITLTTKTPETNSSNTGSSQIANSTTDALPWRTTKTEEVLLANSTEPVTSTSVVPSNKSTSGETTLMTNLPSSENISSTTQFTSVTPGLSGYIFENVTPTALNVSTTVSPSITKETVTPFLVINDSTLAANNTTNFLSSSTVSSTFSPLSTESINPSGNATLTTNKEREPSAIPSTEITKKLDSSEVMTTAGTTKSQDSVEVTTTGTTNSQNSSDVTTNVTSTESTNKSQEPLLVSSTETSINNNNNNTEPGILPWRTTKASGEEISTHRNFELNVSDTLSTSTPSSNDVTTKFENTTKEAMSSLPIEITTLPSPTTQSALTNNSETIETSSVSPKNDTTASVWQTVFSTLGTGSEENGTREINLTTKSNQPTEASGAQTASTSKLSPEISTPNSSIPISLTAMEATTQFSAFDVNNSSLPTEPVTPQAPTTTQMSPSENLPNTTTFVSETPTASTSRFNFLNLFKTTMTPRKKSNTTSSGIAGKPTKLPTAEISLEDSAATTTTNPTLEPKFTSLSDEEEEEYYRTSLPTTSSSKITTKSASKTTSHAGKTTKIPGKETITSTLFPELISSKNPIIKPKSTTKKPLHPSQKITTKSSLRNVTQFSLSPSTLKEFNSTNLENTTSKKAPNNKYNLPESDEYENDSGDTSLNSASRKTTKKPAYNSDEYESSYEDVTS